MNYIKNFEIFLNEKIKISQYRSHHKLVNQEFQDIMKEYFKKFENHDKNYNRIYFDLSEAEIKNDKIPIEINKFLISNGFNIIDYKKGLCKKLSNIGYYNREYKIGKILQELHRDDLLKKFNEDPIRQIKQSELCCVVCRHPYDILGMSTGRGWSSCLDLNVLYMDSARKRNCHEYLKDDLQWGSLVSYLISKNDRNIEKPIGRQSIRVFKNVENDKDLFLVRDIWSGGGINIWNSKNFIVVLDKFISDFNVGKNGIYHFSKDAYPPSIQGRKITVVNGRESR